MSDALIAYHEERARGGVGLMVTGGFSPNIEGWLFPFASKLTSSAGARSHRQITDAIVQTVDVGLLALGRDDQARTVRWIALIGAIVSLLVTLPLYSQFDVGTSAMQFVEKAPWIDRFNVFYHLGIDGISFWFVLLTAFINLVVIISAWEAITERVNQYMGAFLILSGLMVGVFSATDAMLFYVFFEFTLIPLGPEISPAAPKAKSMVPLLMRIQLPPSVFSQAETPAVSVSLMSSSTSEVRGLPSPSSI